MPAPSANSEIFSAENPVLMEVLEGRFATPSGNYFWHRKRAKIKALLERYVRTLPRENRTFVDIGCGLGVDLFFIREWLDSLQPGHWQLQGVEVDPTALGILNLKKAAANAGNLSFTPADITKRLPYEDNSLDVVYSSEVIEHLAEPELLIAEVQRILKPGGAFLLTTPNEPNVFQRTWWSALRREQLKAEMDALKTDARAVTTTGENAFILHHVSLHTVDEWDSLMKQHGFSVDDTERGAMFYGGGNSISGGSNLLDNEWVMGLRFLAEGFLDLFPPSMTRAFSDQLITLYKKA